MQLDLSWLFLSLVVVEMGDTRGNRWINSQSAG